MILTIGEARAINYDITQDELDAFEQTVRALTNNNFQNRHIRFNVSAFVDTKTLTTSTTIIGLKVGDTVEVNYSVYNDGLYTIEEIDGNQIKVQGTPFMTAYTGNPMLTLVSYPADVKQGIKKLIAYDLKMTDKVGIKSETISRMSTTYYDVTAAETVDGYPVAMLSFLKKYEKMRW